MIATLSGEVTEKTIESIVLDVNGVGYGLYIPADDLNRLHVKEQTKLYIYEHIREQSHDLFGFLSPETKQLFEVLLNVNGVGPKMALNMLSIGTIDMLKQSIAAGDVSYIQQASGVGKRLAERVIVELKDKVGLIGIDLASSGLLQSENTLRSDEAIEALISLGYSPVDAAKALQSVDPDLPTEERVKKALKGGNS